MTESPVPPLRQREMNAKKWLRGQVTNWPQWLPRIAKNRDSTNPDLTDAAKPEDLEKSILKILECPVCMEYMTPPIVFCQNGHNICSSCRPGLETCPTCRHPILQARNYSLEDVCYKLNYPCKFHEEGCDEMLSGELIKEHQAMCHHGTHPCPLGRIPEIDCDWNGKFAELVTHLESQHEDRICADAKFLSPETSSSASVVLVHNEIFIFYKCFGDSKCCCVVQIFGTRAQASGFKYKVKLSAENKIEKLSQVNLVRGITEGFDATFRAGHCVRLDAEVVSRYVVDGVMDLQVEVSYTKAKELDAAEQCRVRNSGFRSAISGRSCWHWCK